MYKLNFTNYKNLDKQKLMNIPFYFAKTFYDFLIINRNQSQFIFSVRLCLLLLTFIIFSWSHGLEELSLAENKNEYDSEEDIARGPNGERLWNVDRIIAVWVATAVVGLISMFYKASRG